MGKLQREEGDIGDTLRADAWPQEFRSCLILCDIEFGFLPIQGDPVGMGQAYAMPRIHATDEVFIAIVAADHLVRWTCPEDCKALVDCSLDLQEVHPFAQ